MTDIDGLPNSAPNGERLWEAAECYSSGAYASAGRLGDARDACYQPSLAERDGALYAHLLGAVAAVLTGGALGVAGVVFAAYFPTSTRSENEETAAILGKGPFLLYHQNLSFWFQAFTGLLATCVWVAMWGLSWFLGDLVLLPLVLLLCAVAGLVPLALGLAARQGQWASYPWLGQAVLRRWPPVFRG